MRTKWDALFALFKLRKAKLGVIAKRAGSSSSSTRQKLLALMGEGLVGENSLGEYSPNRKNPKTWNAFNIMKFCKNRGVNYNFFFSGEFAELVRVGIGKEEVYLSDFEGMNCKTARKYLAYLNRINLVFVISKKPLKVKFVREPVFEEVISFFGMEIKKKAMEGKAEGSDAYSEIGALLKEVRELQKNASFTGLEEEAKIEFTSASTQLEGNTFTLEESKQLILNDVIPQDKKLKEANEVKNYFGALDYMIRHIKEPLSIDFIVDLHRVVVYNLGVKEGIRSANVSIKGNPFYKIAHFSQILPMLNELCRKINEFNGRKRSIRKTIEFAVFAHNEFQHIHPFEDGNSRMTRLVWNYVLMRNGFPLINIYANAKEEYLSLTKLARERDDGKLNSFFTGMIKDNLYKRVRGGKADGAG
ncbi:hypothetical protein AUJ17_03255 [Candidatus Micrarchaeota archaeon CG1_02_47_40]|nr:MAG: hypothetical protein AUJ17_03255 [Candidatus Micrarchaeota archaeon CG1_02_47_40]